jgi:hypothetical protein
MAENTNCPEVKECAKFCIDAAKGEGDESLCHKFNEILVQQPIPVFGAAAAKTCRLQYECPTCPQTTCACEKCPEVNESSRGPRFDSSTNHFASGLVSISRKHLFDAYDFGVPMSSNAENENTLILYQNYEALPSNATVNQAAQYNGDIPHMTNAIDATENCDQLNVLFTKIPNKLRQ